MCAAARILLTLYLVFCCGCGKGDPARSARQFQLALFESAYSNGNRFPDRAGADRLLAKVGDSRLALQEYAGGDVQPGYAEPRRVAATLTTRGFDGRLVLYANGDIVAE